ncbi:hypothetical protein [Spiroplasma endosymbiont of Amphimallon solstitiale]|uniref:hypothetical protein n=1 Tax=Spiroplasma endosymbiont of Amphimallon solstitiale TaxID=3066288 RepID=UPI00313E35F9
MIVYTSNDGEEYLYMGTDNDVKAYYQSFGQEWLQTIPGTKGKISFNYVEKYGWPKIIHQFTLKILFLIKNLLKVTLFSVKII